MDRLLPQRCRSIPLVLFAVAVSAHADDRSLRATPCFAAGPTLATSNAPESVAVGDLNGDGNPDVAVANGIADGVALYFGDGAGGFGPFSSLPVGLLSAAVAAADFNGDGLLDLAVATSSNVPTGSNDLVIFLGAGGGAFTSPQTFGLGNTISRPGPSIAVADFNRDGKLDVALGHTNLNSVSIFLGNGAGSFSFFGTFGASLQSLFSIAAGDFNGDGNPDVVGSLDFANAVSVLLGTGTGALGAPTLFPAPPLPIGVAVGDFNGDTRADLAVANEAGGVTSILIGNGLGGFGPPTPFPAGAGSRAIIVADFDTDGRPDVAVANEQSGNVSVLLGDGKGGFGPTGNFSVGTFPHALAAGDFDRDGLPDLAVVNRGSNSVSILLNAAPTLLPAAPLFGVVSGTFPTTQFSASGGTAPYTFTLSGTLPPGLTYNAATATVSGMAAQLGTSTFFVTVTDAAGCSSTRAYSVTITPAFSIVVLTSSANPSVFGQTIRLTATVFPNDPTKPTGIVEFHEGPPAFATAPLVNGVATLDISTLTLGTHVIAAQYLGDANFAPSLSSNQVFQVVLLPEVPTLDGAGLAALGLLLAAAGYAVIRVRS